MNLCAYADENKKLSEMSDEECISFLESQGTEIPEEYLDYIELGSTIKEMITYVESHPKVEHKYNYTAKDELFTNVREAVLKYYDLESGRSSFITTYSTASVASLQYSKALETWTVNCENKNCYGYAILITGRMNPGYTLGVVYSANTISMMTIDRMANLVASDLMNLGYTNITYGGTRPIYQSGYRVLAIRKGIDDFHLMAEVSENIWQHKPGTSVILRYNYSSPESGRWTDEGVCRYGVTGGDEEYTSDIMYIKYKIK